MKVRLVTLGVIAWTCVLLGEAGGSSWNDILDRAEVFAARGAPDSADALVEEAISLALREYEFSDTLAVLYIHREGLFTESYFRSYAEAESLYTRALSIIGRAVGLRCPEYARILNDLGELYRSQRKFSKADSVHREALAIREENFGPESLEAAETLANLVMVCEHTSRHAEGEALCRRALAIREALHEKAHAEIAHSLVRLAWTQSMQGRVADAEPLARKALAVAEEALGPDHREVCSYLFALKIFCQELAKYAEAESLCVRGLEIAERTFGPQHRNVAMWWHSLASIYQVMGRYPEAQRALTQSLAIEEQVYGPAHHILAEKLHLLGIIYYRQGRYAEAEPPVRRAAGLWEKRYGPEHANMAYYLNTLAVLCQVQARYAEAEPLYERALALWEQRHGPQHRLVASALYNLAGTYQAQRRYAEAEPLLIRAAAIWETTLGPDSPELARGLTGLADFYVDRNDCARAEPLYKRALAIMEAALGPDHPTVAHALTSVADVYSEQRRYAEAEPLYERALAIWQKALGRDHASVAWALRGLGGLHYKQGEYASAQPLYLDALAIDERATGKESEDVAWALEVVCKLYRAQGRSPEAVKLASRASRIRHKNFTDNAPVLAEKDALAYSYYLGNSVDTYLTCYVESNLGDSETLSEVADIVLSSKGQVSDGVFERQKSLVQETDSTTLALAEALRYTKFQLSELFVEGPGEDLGAYKAEVDSLTRLANELEGDLSRHSASFRKKEDLKRISTERIVSLLPENSVLVEYVRYDYLELKPERGVPHYMAVVVDENRDISVIDLGEAEEIDGLVEEYRHHMAGVSASGRLPTVMDRQAYAEISEILYGMVWEPLAGRVEGKDLVLVAPDGALSMISFAGLMAADGTYLIEGFPIHHLASGRDLIRLKDEPELARGLFALGDPDYGASASNRLAAVSAPGDTVIQVTVVTRNLRSRCGHLADMAVTPLPGTRREVELVSQSWQEATVEPLVVRYGADASEERFKAEAPGKRVIHLATHGYFLGGACQVDAPQRDRRSEITYVGENPLLLSGLFFAGANLHGEGADSLGAEDGILTAYEVSAMDLKGTELVVLSACETGLGEVTEGEGVYGLRRAFQMAGARTVVSALWPVSDEATAEMMSQLYGRSDESLPETIRRIQLGKIEESRREGKVDHPFTWAAFIALGDWR